jgi:UPF0176 protein
MTTELPIKVAALYRFAPVEDVEECRAKLLNACNAAATKGTILVAYEGINGTIAGDKAGIESVINHIRAIPGFAELDVKYSFAEKMPFYRLKVRNKKEIVTMGVADIDPRREVGRYVDSQDWNALLADPDTIVIDTRNNYEVAIGSFEGAIDPKTKTFRDFPAWFRENRAELTTATNKPKFAMFCTGGIRCEKSTAFLKAEGIDDVYHLEGGILRYLEEVPESESKWQGECFVFDDRVSVKHGLVIGSMELCRACRRPIDATDKAHAAFVEGVSCPGCIDERDDEARERFAQRQLQIKLSKARGEAHIGVDPRDRD